MIRNGYLGTARLASRPAFCCRAAALSCPICRQFSALKVAGYDRHFTGHNPTREQVYAWLPGRSYDRPAARRGWPPTAQLVSEGQVMTGPEAGAFFIGYNSGASSRQGKAHWSCIPPEPQVPDVITPEERNEDHTIRVSYGWTTRLLRD